MVDVVDNLMNVGEETLMEAQMMDGSSSRVIDTFEEQLQIVEIVRQDLGVGWPYRRVTPNVAAEVGCMRKLLQGVFTWLGQANSK